ncbi:phosphonoacetaldehyde hydrolase [Tetragenococcus koreensis]|uniref:phosphonoacetaldehyde hydrolase n=1 Tax=Tetragenococcus koreensis TaxID=290335 RepID=UPI001F3CE363|nr:phosphonoacetaldehyde hydrolase [Tetragenococcus koreensis]MCF1585576.1 phosphonoacetaldehyde hydrolase [Tetragenococcus koreensis]MCF1615122.1 phosphonoacetaldehyde hydrolase [Tetragenococcus koreensis]MCF1619573.1 phosphonoacetaldehyde hydrolase [Tetragenococcus koreensis]MCF1624950.1 phosphonoacetaldehyde hydrolase [Tetragenococcus koreensis]MCF1629842.1 phosphonoacetaldehyde hydrolase [Tetragenococcus koreensis]
MGSEVEGVIFDWAGTTVDFGCFAPVDTFIEVFKKHSITTSAKEAREPMGLNKLEHLRAMLAMPRINKLWKETLQRESNEQDLQNLYETFETTLLSILPRYSEPISGVVETINWLRAKGLKIGSTTGYTPKMMEILLAEARKKGLEVDACYTSVDTNSLGRPYPYMIFRNMESLKMTATNKVIKVGDTLQDLKEARNAGVWSAGVIIGSSELGLTLAEFQALSEKEQAEKIQKVEDTFLQNGADFTIQTISELPDVIQKVNRRLSNK